MVKVSRVGDIVAETLNLSSRDLLTLSFPSSLVPISQAQSSLISKLVLTSQSEWVLIPRAAVIERRKLGGL